MPTLPSSRYIFILLISLLVALGPVCQGQTSQQDSTGHSPADSVSRHRKKVDSCGRQLLVGVDLFHPVINHITGNQYGLEAEVLYYSRNEFYLAFEGGSGGASVNYSNLQYNTSNSFFRFGFNKSLLSRYSTRDWDMMFFGLRAAGAVVNRSPASYTVVDSIWGNYSGKLPQGSIFPAIWGELTMGMRVEIAPRLLIGWNIRGKFMMNAKSFVDLSPVYIAGYGRGDKNAVFDFDVYLSYAFRWNRRQATAAAVMKPAQ